MWREIGGEHLYIRAWDVRVRGKRGSMGRTYLLKSLSHDLWSVVDGEDNVRDTCSSQRLDLVQNHGLVAELDEGLGEGERLLKRVRLLAVRSQIVRRRHARTYQWPQASAKAADENEGCGPLSVCVAIVECGEQKSFTHPSW